MFTNELEVVEGREAILGCARAFAVKHREIVPGVMLIVPNEFGALCGIPNAYSAITLPACPETRETLLALKADPGRVLREVPPRDKAFARSSLLKSVDEALAAIAVEAALAKPEPGDVLPPGVDGPLFVKVFISRTDKNGDGMIEKVEWRGSAARFDQVDKDKDGKLDRAEVAALTRPPAGGRAKGHYEIKGFYVFPLPRVLLGQTTDAVRGTLGEPAEVFRGSFREPVRVALKELPSFDEQWGYTEELANNWVFFRGGKVVAAFREESDF